MGPRVLLSAVLVLVLALPRTVRADDGGVPPGAEIAALEAEIAKGAALLASGSCAIACQALTSMQRAAERLCALDPGPRCAAARARAQEAARRVREACPTCGPSGEVPPPERANQPKEAPAPTEPSVTPLPPAPPPPPAAEAVVRRGGGCAGCVASGDEDAAYAGAFAALAAIAACARRRRRAG